MVFRKLFARAPAPPAHELAPDSRVYAIGDVHGQLGNLDRLLSAIDADQATRGPVPTTTVFLGDLVDRGPASRQVVERAMQLERERTCVFIMGNHEEILIRAWEGDRRAAGLFHRVGGRETLLSYGVEPARYDACDLGDLATLVGKAVPVEHIAFLRGFQDSWTSGDYLFVHAGIRPGLALDLQRDTDLRWIRSEFLEDARDHGIMVVHGHTISEDVDERPNRIGIDTGAYQSGRLTALGLQGTERWTLSG